MSLPAILVVEDSQSDQNLIIALLTKFDFSGHIVKSVDEALAAVRGQKFAVVLISLDMAEVDATDCIHQIKQVELDHTSQTPIIAMGGASEDEFQKTGLAAEVDGYLQKPPASENLRRLLLRHAYEARKPNLKTLRPLTGEDSLPDGG